MEGIFHGIHGWVRIEGAERREERKKRKRTQNWNGKKWEGL